METKIRKYLVTHFSKVGLGVIFFSTTTIFCKISTRNMYFSLINKTVKTYIRKNADLLNLFCSP